MKKRLNREPKADHIKKGVVHWTQPCRNSGGLGVLDRIEMQERMMQAISLYDQAKGIRG
ncbi:hypothetical protein [Exiguobacterium sp. S22-S28]|uniref:hypothetical protein n=1 Tax=Exiguobacterium sp. S22-S28 TaxID=3342768 RepID=UPI00372D59E7